MRVHHCKNSLFPGRLACPIRKAVTVDRLKGGARASAQGRAAPTAPPGPCEAACGIEEPISHNSAQRRPPGVPDDMRVPGVKTTPRHRPTNPADK